MSANMHLSSVRPILARAIAQLTLPKLPAVRSQLWLTHASALGPLHVGAEKPRNPGSDDYVRLAHVGDALLGNEVTLLIHEKYPQLVVGARTVARAALVENSALSRLAVAFQMPNRILAAAGQGPSIRKNTTVQASVFEAYLAVLNEELGPARLKEFLRKVYTPLLPLVVDASSKVPRTDEEVKGQASTTNYVGLLGEWKDEKGMHGRRVQFDEPRQSVPDHRPIWTVTCTVVQPDDDAAGAYCEFKGSAGTVAKAKNAAAMSACQTLGIDRT
ncbi:hypothetical protein JCM3774_004781 [Rhodotorula dairenensis]